MEKTIAYSRLYSEKSKEYHSYSTRSAHHVHIPSVKLDLSKTGIKYRGTIVWKIIAESGINLEVFKASFNKNSDQIDKHW